MIDLLDRRIINFENIRFVVLDEVDRMLDIGFRDDIRNILSRVKGGWEEGRRDGRDGGTKEYRGTKARRHGGRPEGAEEGRAEQKDSWASSESNE